MFLRTIAEAEATGKVAEIYAKQKAELGFVMSAMQCWTTRPDLLPLYMDFTAKARGGFSLGQREWKLITLIAAKHIPSSYCSHVYSKQLLGELGSKETVLAVQRDFRNAGLSAQDVAMLAYAEKIAKDASQVTRRTSTACVPLVSATSRSATSRSAPRGAVSSAGSSTRLARVPSWLSSTAIRNSAPR